jgi:hypothetical protein
VRLCTSFFFSLSLYRGQRRRLLLSLFKAKKNQVMDAADIQQQHRQHGASATVSSEPQFATVTFVGEDNVQGSTFRVPLSSSTTVSRLAKDAMKRLVLSRPAEDRHRQFPALVVTEVYVGGAGTQPKAEVFAQDIVNQVVLVREEVIYMKLRTGAASASAVSSRLPTPLPPPREQQEVEATQRGTAEHIVVGAAEVPLKTTAAASQTAREHKEDRAPASTTPSAAQSKMSAKQPVNTTAPTQAPPKQQPTSKAHATSKARASTVDVAGEDEVTELAAAVTHPKRPGWGPQAHEQFADNYVSTPGKRPRNTTRKPVAASRDAKAAKTESVAKTARQSKTTLTNSVTVSADESGVAAPQTQDHETRGLRWGPEASKSFPANYVSSPQKLARLARQQRRRVCSKESVTQTASAAETAAAATLVPPPGLQPAQKTRVSRELVFPVADLPDSGRTTVGHPVEREVVTVEEDPATPSTEKPLMELPKGWGAESLRYFDPNTYCDDPTKARLLPNMDLSRSRRQRRPASP